MHVTKKKNTAAKFCELRWPQFPPTVTHMGRFQRGSPGTDETPHVGLLLWTGMRLGQSILVLQEASWPSKSWAISAKGCLSVLIFALFPS